MLKRNTQPKNIVLAGLMDDSFRKVLRWAEEKQKGPGQNEKVVILNFFNITNVK